MVSLGGIYWGPIVPNDPEGLPPRRGVVVPTGVFLCFGVGLCTVVVAPMGFPDPGVDERVDVVVPSCPDWCCDTVLVDIDCGDSVDVVVYATMELWSVVVVVSISSLHNAMNS